MTVPRAYPLPDPWTRQAACTNADPDLFYPEGDNRRIANASRTIALSICSRCPVAAPCLAYALACERVDPYRCWGIWGGTLPQQRRRMLDETTVAATP